MRYWQWILLCSGINLIIIAVALWLQIPLTITILVMLGAWLCIAWIPIDRKG